MGEIIISKRAAIYPATSGGTSTSATALVAAGESPFVDGTAFLDTTTAGIHVFNTDEITGLELHFSLASIKNGTATARIFRAIPAFTSQANATAFGSPSQWTYRHLCTVSLVASVQGSVTSGVLTDGTKAERWASVTVSSDAGLAPTGTRTMNGTTTDAAGSLVIDPLGAPRIVVQTCIGTADSVTCYANDWTGM